MAGQAKAPVSRKRALSAAAPPSFEACVVTYISQDRAFQRVFAETDIEGMKNVVREKLNLAPNTGLRLAQVVEGRRIDLEDDADFCAFQLGARLKPELKVEVCVIAPPAAQLASPSVTATSINLDRAPPPPLTQTEKDEVPHPADGSSSTLIPPPKKKKKSRTSNLVIVENDVGASIGEQAEPVEPTTSEQASKAPKSKAKAADPAPPATTTEPAKKPKPKVKSVPPADQETTSILGASKIPDDTAVEAIPTPSKSKKDDKVVAATTPTPAPETAPTATTEPIPETPSADTEIPQPRPKKRRKAAQDAEKQEPPAPEAAQTVEPPAKKQRKSKAEVIVKKSGTESPVATTLPPPVRSERRSSTVLSVPDSDKPVSSVGSAADILRRWGALSAATEAAASSGAGPSTTTEVADQSTEIKTKAKRKKKKKKDQAVENAPTSTVAPVPDTPEATQCLVCSSGPHESLECPLLSQRDAPTAKLVEERIYNLEDTQGSARIHQMLIGRLRSWLKDTKKQVEAQNRSIIPASAPPIQKGASPAHSTPVPTRPKKSKLSSVVVSHQSEGSSTDDEDILKSVMESRIDSAEDDDGEDEEMADAPQPEPQSEPAQEQREISPPSTPTPEPTSVPLLPSSSPATKPLLQSQRMSQSSVRAFLDGLESEEAGAGEKDSSDEEGSDLAQSTPSEVARRRHRKSVRLDVEDSDEEAAARGQTRPQDEGGDSDVEMRDAGDEQELTTLSQLLDSSEEAPEEIVGVVDEDRGEEKDADDIEEYEDEEVKNDEAPDGAADSPIETPDQEPVAAEDEVAETPQVEEPEPAEEDESEPKPELAQEPEPAASTPKKRGRPPLSQAVKDERAAEKARIQAEKAAMRADPSAPKKRGRPPKSKGVEGADTSVNGKPESTGPTTRKRSESVGGSQESGPRPRGRPRLSEAEKAEREAEKERVRQEKAIQRLEKKTAKANAKAAAKQNGANTTAPVDDEEHDEDEDATVRQSFHASAEAAESPTVPAWSTLKNPSSSRPGSSQADEIEWSATEVGEDAEAQKLLGSQSSAVKPTPDTRTRKGSAPARPLFMPSSGLGPRFLPPMTPVTSTPAPGKLQSLSQQTPSHTLQRRKSIGSASLPRFSNLREQHDIQQRSRKERNRLLSSQPITSQELKSKPNGTSGVVTIESSDEEVDSSADEAKNPKPQSQKLKKRPSAFAYFEQQ